MAGGGMPGGRKGRVKHNMKNCLKVERARHNMTQQDLADAVKVSRQTVHAIETGKFVPSTVLALKLARCFQMPLEQLFTLEEHD